MISASDTDDGIEAPRSVSPKHKTDPESRKRPAPIALAQPEDGPTIQSSHSYEPIRIDQGSPRNVHFPQTAHRRHHSDTTSDFNREQPNFLTRLRALAVSPGAHNRAFSSDGPENPASEAVEGVSAPATPRPRLRPSLFSSNSILSARRSSDGSPWRKANSAGRPNTLRRLTNINDDRPSSPWIANRAERAKVVSSAKWRQVKAGLRTMGQRRKAENKIDQAKSAELLAELTAGAPVALMFASMFQRDEHGNRRIPILLEQLKVHITDSRPVDGERHMIFRIELEYGNGPTRMKWVIDRALRDFANLHARYKVQIKTQKYVHLRSDDTAANFPHFPRSAFPYLRGFRGVDDSDSSDSGKNPHAELATGDGKRIRPGLRNRRKSSIANLYQADGKGRERQRKKLETYLQQMIRFLIFRPESNRLCRFLELSALGVRLAGEGGYHGKEGLLAIKSGRRAWASSLIGPKWFAVRDSYVVCVDSPEAMNIYDVFLVDSNFRISSKRPRIRDQQGAKDMAKVAAHPQHHALKIFNSERTLKLLAKGERHLHQFQESILHMCTNSPWARPKRFHSFAPVRENVFAQWLVDGRDYMWNASRAISMAKDVIYIHDWWLSPELYMRRPAAISQKWRLDRLLQQKAREGVKVFVIMYRNINSAIPIDSEYSKFSLLDLHPNIFVQRSPNQFRQNTFFWAHHEKLCLIDHMVAFIGGIDLCFGRWDTPQHVVVDDKITGFEASTAPKDTDHCQLWPGKDYSNPRVQDFYALDRPYEEMYDRAKVPRMPWHDIHMQIVGQPARDLTRHFVQRWNYILRQRKPTRPTPFLLPPPDFDGPDLDLLGLKGTCEIQILRSACEWSLGTPGVTEHSIMNAYVKLIEQSDHFVYIENQFFISSCEVEGTRMENTIGDALVERIIRASEGGEAWRAVIIIPLMPGFQNTVAEQDGTSVRLIMQCQYRSICRGENSIFARLRAVGLEPADFIQFYSLRSWGQIGPAKQLVTEQLYIHAKCMIVDDRVAIIGSANINERSMLGSRDSECAAVVRDTDMLDSQMNGKPYPVGRFPHTLRMRLMREHLGIDVDHLGDMDMAEAEVAPTQGSCLDVHSRLDEDEQAVEHEVLIRHEQLVSFNGGANLEQAQNPHLKSSRRMTEDPRVTQNAEHRKSVDGDGHDRMNDHLNIGSGSGRDTILADGPHGKREVILPLDQDPGMKEAAPEEQKPEIAISNDCMLDPLADVFMLKIWHAVAESNTRIFREVFRCMPDDEVKTWKDYKEYVAYAERLAQAHGGCKSKERIQQDASGISGPPGQSEVTDRLGPIGEALDSMAEKTGHERLDGRIEDWAHDAEKRNEDNQHKEAEKLQRASTDASQHHRPRRRATTRASKLEFRASDDIISKEEARLAMQGVQGHLVLWPYDWLQKEEQGGNWLYSIDGLAPLEI